MSQGCLRSFLIVCVIRLEPRGDYLVILKRYRITGEKLNALENTLVDLWFEQLQRNEYN